MARAGSAPLGARLTDGLRGRLHEWRSDGRIGMAVLVVAALVAGLIFYKVGGGTGDAGASPAPASSASRDWGPTPPARADNDRDDRVDTNDCAGRSSGAAGDPRGWPAGGRARRRGGDDTGGGGARAGGTGHRRDRGRGWCAAQRRPRPVESGGQGRRRRTRARPARRGPARARRSGGRRRRRPERRRWGR